VGVCLGVGVGVGERGMADAGNWGGMWLKAER